MPTIKPANFPVLNPDSIRSPQGKSWPAENSQRVISNPGINEEAIQQIRDTAPDLKNIYKTTTDKLVQTSEAEQSRNNRPLFYHPNRSKLKQPQPLGQFVDIKI